MTLNNMVYNNYIGAVTDGFDICRDVWVWNTLVFAKYHLDEVSSMLLACHVHNGSDKRSSQTDN